METNFSEKAEEILKEANKEINSFREKYNEIKSEMPEREEFEKNLSRFDAVNKQNKEATLEIYSEFIEVGEKSKKTLEEIIELSQQSIKTSEEIIETSNGDEFFVEHLKDERESLNDSYKDLISTIKDLYFTRLEARIAEELIDSTPEYIPADDFIKKCDEWLEEFERDINFKKDTKFEELLTKDADDFVSDAITPIEEAFAKVKVYAKLYDNFLRNADEKGCYVATAVYGSYDCPQVWTLRRYRDNELAKTWFGRAFIHTYYAISPTVVKYFGNTEWFKKMWRNKLDRMVKKLQSKGFECTPYNDKEW